MDKIRRVYRYRRRHGNRVRLIAIVAPAGELVAGDAIGLCGRNIQRVSRPRRPLEGFRGREDLSVHNDVQSLWKRRDGCLRIRLAIQTLHCVQIARRQPRALADWDSHWDRLHGEFAIAGETARAIVHDRSEIITAQIIRTGELLIVLQKLPFVEIGVDHLHVEVTVLPRLLVVKANGMANLMNGAAKGTVVAKIDRLRSANNPDEGRTPGRLAHEPDIIGLIGPGYQPQPRVVIPMLHRAGDALLIGYGHVNRIRHDAIRPAESVC